MWLHPSLLEEGKKGRIYNWGGVNRIKINVSPGSAPGLPGLFLKGLFSRTNKRNVIGRAHRILGGGGSPAWSGARAGAGSTGGWCPQAPVGVRGLAAPFCPERVALGLPAPPG